MRKLVKAGLTVPVILLVALATFGLGMAAEDGDLNEARTLNAREGDSISGARVRGTDTSVQSADSVDGLGEQTLGDDSDRGANARNSTASSRPARRGRQAPRASSSSSFDEMSWWWWNQGKGGGNDEDEDEDDDEDMSPSGW